MFNCNAFGERGIASSQKGKTGTKKLQMTKFGLSNYGSSQVTLDTRTLPTWRHRRQASGQAVRQCMHLDGDIS